MSNIYIRRYQTKRNNHRAKPAANTSFIRTPIKKYQKRRVMLFYAIFISLMAHGFFFIGLFYFGKTPKISSVLVYASNQQAIQTVAVPAVPIFTPKELKSEQFATADAVSIGQKIPAELSNSALYILIARDSAFLPLKVVEKEKAPLAEVLPEEPKTQKINPSPPVNTRPPQNVGRATQTLNTITAEQKKDLKQWLFLQKSHKTFTQNYESLTLVLDASGQSFRTWPLLTFLNEEKNLYQTIKIELLAESDGTISSITILPPGSGNSAIDEELSNALYAARFNELDSQVQQAALLTILIKEPVIP